MPVHVNSIFCCYYFPCVLVGYGLMFKPWENYIYILWYSVLYILSIQNDPLTKYFPFQYNDYYNYHTLKLNTTLSIRASGLVLGSRWDSQGFLDTNLFIILCLSVAATFLTEVYSWPYVWDVAWTRGGDLLVATMEGVQCLTFDFQRSTVSSVKDFHLHKEVTGLACSTHSDQWLCCVFGKGDGKGVFLHNSLADEEGQLYIDDGDLHKICFDERGWLSIVPSSGSAVAYRKAPGINGLHGSPKVTSNMTSVTSQVTSYMTSERTSIVALQTTSDATPKMTMGMTSQVTSRVTSLMTSFSAIDTTSIMTSPKEVDPHPTWSFAPLPTAGSTENSFNIVRCSSSGNVEIIDREGNATALAQPPMRTPSAVTVDSEGNIYVCYSNTIEIHVYSRDGVALQEMEVDLQTGRPECLALSLPREGPPILAVGVFDVAKYSWKIQIHVLGTSVSDGWHKQLGRSHETSTSHF